MLFDGGGIFAGNAVGHTLAGSGNRNAIVPLTDAVVLTCRLDWILGYCIISTCFEVVPAHIMVPWTVKLG